MGLTGFNRRRREAGEAAATTAAAALPARPLASDKKAAWQSHAEALGIDVSTLKTKPDLVAAVDAHEATIKAEAEAAAKRDAEAVAAAEAAAVEAAGVTTLDALNPTAVGVQIASATGDAAGEIVAKTTDETGTEAKVLSDAELIAAGEGKTPKGKPAKG